MSDKQLELLKEINSKQVDTGKVLFDYWQVYSDMGTWQFWAVFILLFALPLIILYFVIDREKIFLIGFYGLNLNVWFNLIDGIGEQLGWWIHPYMTIPIMNTGFSVNSALVPIVFMLVYQWTLNHNKNFYLYSLLAAMVFAFIFYPLESVLNFAMFSKGTSYFNLLLGFISLFLFSKLITSVFLHMHKTNKTKSKPI